MPTIHKFLLAALASVLLSACGAIPFNIPADYQLNAGKGSGVAVFSVSEGCPSTMSIKIKGASAFDEVIAIDQSKAIRPAPLQWQNPCGRLIVRELPAGSYHFSSFVLVGAVPSVTYLQPLKDMNLPFSVVAGKVSYLGHLNFELFLSQRLYSARLEDRRDRDIPLLKTLVRSIGDEDIFFQAPQRTVEYAKQPLQAVRVMFLIVR